MIEKNPDYWGKPGEADKITFRIMPENSTRLAALEAGEVQVADNLPPDKLSALRSNPELQVVFTPTLRVDYMIMNFRNPLMDDIKFREALSPSTGRASSTPARRHHQGGEFDLALNVGYDASSPVYAYDPE